MLEETGKNSSEYVNNSPKTLYLAQDSSLENSTNLKSSYPGGVSTAPLGKIPSIDSIPGQQYSVSYQVQVPEEFYAFPKPSDTQTGITQPRVNLETHYTIPTAKLPSLKNSEFHGSVPRPLPSLKQDHVARINPTLGQLAVKFQSYSGADNKLPPEDHQPDLEGDDDEEGGGDASLCVHGAEHTGRWTKREHELFLEALKKHGKEWKKVAAMVKTRTVVQTRTHAQKYFQKVQKYIFPEHHETVGDSGHSGHSSSATAAATASATSVSTSEMMQRPLPTASNLNQQPHSYINHALLHQNKKVKIDPETIISTSQPLIQTSPPPPVPIISLKSSPVVMNEPDEDYFYSDPDKPKEISPQSPLKLTSRYQRTDLPPPSPASCGKRKKEEISVAQFLSGSTSPIDLQSGVQALTKMKSTAILRNKPPPRSSRPGNGIGLSIINPDTLPSIRSEDEPNTPWDGDMRELETKRKTSTLHVAAQTTIEQNEFIRQVCEYSLSGNVEILLHLLNSAKFSLYGGEARGSVVNQDIGRAKTPNLENGDDTLAILPPPSTSSSTSSISSTTIMGGGDSSDPNKSLLSEMLNRVNDQDESILMIVCARKLSTSSPPMLQSHLLEVIKILVEYGANVTLVNNKLQTCLHIVSREGYDLIAHFLILKGCPVNAVDISGDTAAHIASRQGHLNVIQVLTNCGANFHLRNNSWRCPLDVADDCPELHLTRLDIRRSILTMEPRLRSLVLYHEDCLEHAARRESDWEGPDRLTGIMNLIMDTKSFPSYQVEITNQFPKAPVEMLSRVHSSEYIAFVNTLSKKVQESGNSSESSNIVPFTPQVQRSIMKQEDTAIKHPDGCDTSFSPGTLKAARRAAGAVAHAVDRVLLNRNRNAFCVVRPPGHHAGYNGLLDGAKSCGFCIFNSVAAGALHALEAHNCERVAIIDIDVHHGNGTEDIVRRYQHPSRLFFFSVHLFDKDDPPNQFEFFPGSGREDDTTHNIINVPITPMWQEQGPSSHGTRSTSKATGNGAKCGRDAFKQAILQRLIPSLRAFSPDLILVSTGFDPAAGDVGNTKHEVGGTTIGMNLRPIDFEWVTMELVKIADICCNGRLVSVLEGGYGSYSTTNSGLSTTTSSSSSSSSTSSSSKVNKSEKSKGGGYLDRSILSEAAGAHLRSLIDPYGYIEPESNSN